MRAPPSKTCKLCGRPVSVLGAYAQLAQGRLAHTSCVESEAYERGHDEAGKKASSLMAELERAWSEERTRLRREVLEAKASAPTKAGEPVPVPPKDKGFLSRPEWDALAEKVITKQIISLGPLLPQSTLKSYLWRLYVAFQEAGLIVQILEEKPVNEPERKVTLEEYLKGGK